MEHTLEHEHIGRVVGSRHGPVVEYLGIPYAVVASRLARPEVKTQYNGSLQATNHGPAVSAPPVGCDIEMSMIQHDLPKPDFPGMSDELGLNLNIVTPSEMPLEDSVLLPVVVFIHGGGFVFGGNWMPHLDMKQFVRLSILVGRPVIAVTINYRLGVAGFLDSQELRMHGFPSNRGLLDQQTAFRWLSKNAAGFGGNPFSITAIGQSAGGASVMYCQSSPKQLFHRAVCLSGNTLISSPLDSPSTESAYQTVLGDLGLLECDPEERIHKLQAISSDILLQKVSLSIPLGPSKDACHYAPDETQSSEHWAKRLPLMIGSTSFDGSVFEVMGMFKAANAARRLYSAILDRVGAHQEPLVANLFQLYNLSSQSSNHDACHPILQFGTDLKYFATSLFYAKLFPERTHFYFFQQKTSWKGKYQGCSTHVQDIAYLFQNYNTFMDENERAVALAFAHDVLTFAYGDSPYATFDDSGNVRVYGLSDQCAGEILSHSKIGPSPAIRNAWEAIGLEILSTSWDVFLRGG